MSYLNVISLATAKNYLRVDDTLTEDDADITRMIQSSLSDLERQTNIKVFDRDEVYVIQDCLTRVYDYPINALVTPTDAEAILKPNYTNYTTQEDDVLLTLNVGYTDPLDVPYELIDVALEMIDIKYYGAKEDGANRRLLSKDNQDIINRLKRFTF